MVDALPPIMRSSSSSGVTPRPWEAMLSSVEPVISAINGVAVGAGLAVALLADVSIMARSARLSDGHARLGVGRGRSRRHSLAVALSMAKAKYYLMTGDFVDRPRRRGSASSPGACPTRRWSTRP